jgi:hypothetical protein
MTDIERTKWPDDVKRVKDEMDMHAVAGSYGYVVIALADGKPLDHAAYPTWGEAVRAAKWDRDNYMFLEIQPDGMPYREAQAVLKYARTIHQLGHRIPSPEWAAGPLVASMPDKPWDRKRMMKQLKSGKPLDPIGYSNFPVKKG